MSSYISSNANRFYAAIEPSYGQAAAITGSDRFPAVRLHAHQSLETGKRLDKTGSRTFLGASSSSRRQTTFEVQTYLTSWNGTGEPSYGPFFEAGLGAPAALSTGLTIASVQGPLQLQTSVLHGLSVGSAVSYSNEIRFVTGIIDSQTFTVNAPFKSALQSGSALAPDSDLQVVDRATERDDLRFLGSDHCGKPNRDGGRGRHDERVSKRRFSRIYV